MQQFVVPQFLDVEDKVIGPITVRQFIILLISGGIEFAAWRFADLSLFLLISFFNAVFTILFAFIKINGRPIHFFLLNIIQTSKRPWLRLWIKEFDSTEFHAKKEAAKDKRIEMPKSKYKVGTSRLAELSLIVDTGGMYEGEGNNKIPNS